MTDTTDLQAIRGRVIALTLDGGVVVGELVERGESSLTLRSCRVRSGAGVRFDCAMVAIPMANIALVASEPQRPKGASALDL